MIIATIKTSSMYVDKPKITTIKIDENIVAGEKPDPITHKPVKVTIGELFDIFKSGKQYFKDSSDPEDQIIPKYFEQWFYKHYIHEKGIMQRILSIDYHKEKS